MLKKLLIIKSNICILSIILSLLTLQFSCSEVDGNVLENDINTPVTLQNLEEAKEFYYKKSLSNSENSKKIDSKVDGKLSDSFFDIGIRSNINSRRNITQASDLKITASDGTAEEYFGIDVAAGPNMVVVGAMISKNKQGKAYIYNDNNGHVTETILKASTGHIGDSFGKSVNTDGTWVIVGAPGDQTNGNSAGASYLFQWDGASWIEKQKLLADDGKSNDIFGSSVAIYDDTLVVGAHGSGDKGKSSGSVYVFKYDGFIWKQEKKLLAFDGAKRDYFGYSVAIDKDRIVVGSYGDDDNGNNSGSAYVYEKENGFWSKITKLLPIDGSKGDRFGISVAIDNDTILIGAQGDDDNGKNSGSVYSYIRTRLDFFVYSWEQDQKITPSDAGQYEYFGSSVSISNNNAVIGAHLKNETEIYAGAAYLFKQISTGDDYWTETTKFIADTPQKLAQMGAAVDIYDDKIIAGAVGVEGLGTNSGGVYVFNNLYSNMINRNNVNTYHKNTELLSARAHKRHMQQFVNNLDRIETIAIKIGGNVELKYQDQLTMILRDGCGNEITRRVSRIDSTGLTSETSWKWMYIDLDVDVKYGKIYNFELSTYWASHSQGTKIVINTDQYRFGKLISKESSYLYPKKKRDVIFNITGKVDKNKQFLPFAESNIACPGRCRSVYDEKNSYPVDNYFNIVIKEKRQNEDGSFWEDYTSDHLDDLKEDIKLMLESNDGMRKGIKHVVPYNEYFSKMNFYIAVVNPDDDQMEYQMYCANSDGEVQVYDDYPFGGGSFGGGVLRPSMNDENWVMGTPSRLGANVTSVHELFGHGISFLHDEYTSPKKISPRETSYRFNNDEIGCPRWCTSSKDVYQVESESDSACWDLDKAACQDNKSCWYLSNDELSYEIPSYFEEKTCIPKNITRQNIGIDCDGNAGCYIGAPDGTRGEVYLNVAQPSGIIMQSFHGNAAEGFTTPVENEIRTQLQCMFPLTCHNYDFEKCNKFQEDWRHLFGDFISACEETSYGTQIYRRR